MSTQLNNYVELQAEKAENLSICKGIKLLHIRDTVNELLSHIGRCGLFEEYTLHSIEHIDEMLRIIEWLIPEETKQTMTSAEWLMLTLAVYFHDLGMVITKEEFNSRYNTQFKEYKNKALNDTTSSEYKEYVMSNSDDHFLYQEFVRENHAKRIKLWIEESENTDLGEASTVREEISKVLSELDRMFKADLAMVCESHHKNDIDDFSTYKVSVSYGNSDDERVNLNYIAIILRIADLLHITKDRTPSITRKLINVSNPVSILEWEKQQAVRAVKPKPRRNDEGNIDESLERDTIEITAYFDGADTAEAYFGLSAYLQYAKKELEKCCEIVTKAQKTEGAVKYKFPWTSIDESQIIAVGFEPKKLSFTIAQENILQLLVGHTLYNDSSVVVRELVQNGIDAVKLQNHIEKRNGYPITDGSIRVCWKEESRELSFWDNGTGMTIQDVENYLLKVGASKYRDESVRKLYPDFNSISHFGIGILTCFMIANDVDITTCSESEEKANVINLRRVNGSYLLRRINKSELDEKIRTHGTIVTLHVRNDIDMRGLEEDLKKWIVVPEVPVFLYEEEQKKETRIGYDSLSDILKKYLNESGKTVDGKKYDVIERTLGNVTIAYAVRYMKYLSDWGLIDVDPIRKTKHENLPIGTCIEGIRVEFTTPGYKGASILAIANVKDSKYQTNVARSAIELDSNRELLSGIYGIFSNYIAEQMDNLEQDNYSKSWAISEGTYLMQPLVGSEFSNTHVEPVDEEILIRELAKLKCMIIENEGKRDVVSAVRAYELDELNVIECKMTQAAEFLLRELKCSATLQELIEVVYSDGNFLANTKNILCNYNNRNMLHQYALRNKGVSSIKVNRQQRSIHLTYTQNSELWDLFRLRITRRNTTDLYIPNKEFKIAGLEEEIGVKTIGGIYIRSDSEIYQYVRKVIGEFQREDTEENRLLLELFLSNVFDPRTLEIVYKKKDSPNYTFKRILEESYFFSENLLTKLWAKIDMEEFSKSVLTQNYTLYSIDNWSRNEKIL